VLRAEVDASAIKLLRAQLNELEPGLANELGKEMKQILGGPVSRIQSSMPASSPLSNLVYGDRVWSPSKVTLSVRAGAGFGKPMALISAEGRPNKAMAKIVEFAGKGKRDYVKGARGRALIRNLNEKQSSPAKEGRFFFQAYKKAKPEMYAAIGRVLNKYVELASRKMN
jgi:hypothetical protein